MLQNKKQINIIKTETCLIEETEPNT
jgi:hypothetical protein